MRVTPIGSPLPGEHLATTFPVIRPETDDAGWRLRLDFWAGRSLTADALEIEQGNRAARLAWRGRAATAGIVTGLEVALEPPPGPQEELTPADHFVHVLPGHGFLVNGEDIVVPRPLRVPLDRIPVHYVRFGAVGVETLDEDAPADATPGQVQDAGGFAFAVDDFAVDYRPWAAVLLLCPAEFKAFERLDPSDPCELDLSRDAFADERRVDACVLRFCQLPVRMQDLPPLADPNDPRWRNRLAHAVFEEEASRAPRHYLHFLETRPVGQRWGTDLLERGLLPWELLGVPLALFSTEAGTEAATGAYFLDRASVTRPGAHARSRTRPLVSLATGESDATRHLPGVGTPATWRAGVDQLAEHIGALNVSTEADVAALASRLQFLPPVGLLPRQVLTLLTTSEALAIPPRPNQPPDRAGVNYLFPRQVTVEAVPVAVEDLDTALAGSAALAPYDLLSEDEDNARLLVPVPQRVFDPALLVVEQEDPVFAQTVARFVATRQDWRQRRDFVRAQREALQKVATGKPVDAPQPTLEPGQLEPEPVESAVDLGFTTALLSPSTTAGPWEIAVNLAGARDISATATLFLRLRIDLDAMPSRIEARWQTSSGELRFAWTEPPPPPAEQTDDGVPIATPLWLRFTVAASDLGVTRASITAVTLHVDNGRVAIADLGEVIDNADGVRDEAWWTAQDESAPVFTGGEWTPLATGQLLAPFEAQFEPTFADDLTLAGRLDDLDTQLRLTDIKRVRETGLETLIERLVSELNQSDDAVDLDFLKAQSNIHRIRQVMLGEEVANELLTSPTLGSVVNQKSARVAQETLISTLNAVPSQVPTEAPVAGGGGAGILAAGPQFAGFNAGFIKSIHDPGLGLSFEATAAAAPRGFRLDVGGVQADVAVRDDVVAAQPSIGRGFELRTLTIAKRFDDGATRGAYDYADTELRATVARIAKLPLEFDDEDMIPEVTDNSNALKPVSFLQLARGGDAVLRTLRFPSLSDADDSGAVFAKGVRRADTTVLILRRLEFYIARKRAQLGRAREVLGAVRAQQAAAAGRVIAIEGRLAEARHDVSVARALRQEEQQRVAAINDRRDALIRDEVRFLAYVRPRTVDPVRRNLVYWKLDPFDVQAPVPACLQRHDEAPPALAGYVQLFQHSPARWFTALVPLFARLDTRDKVVALLESVRTSAASFVTLDAAGAARGSPPAVQLTLLGAHQAIGALRQKSTLLQIGDARNRKWTDIQRDATEHASIGDLIAGRHGSHDISTAAAGELEQMSAVATCLHAEFAAVPPAIRLSWIERYSQFDKPGLLRDLTALPQYAKLDRATRRRLQAFVDWLFGRVSRSERDALNLMNDLVRLCLLLASHAPVNRIIAGHVPRPTPVRPGILVPIRPINPDLVRVGMEFHVWQASRVVARGLVQDLHDGEVSARVDHVDAQTTTLDSTMRVQFVAQALSLFR